MGPPRDPSWVPAHRLHVGQLLQAFGQALQLCVVPHLLLLLLLDLPQQETPGGGAQPCSALPHMGPSLCSPHSPLPVQLLQQPQCGPADVPSAVPMGCAVLRAVLPDPHCHLRELEAVEAADVHLQSWGWGWGWQHGSMRGPTSNPPPSMWHPPFSCSSTSVCPEDTITRASCSSLPCRCFSTS